MGMYINRTSNGPLDALGKLEALFEDGAEMLGISGPGSELILGAEKYRVIPPFQKDLCCLIHNGPFEAVIYCYDEAEYNYVVNDSNTRPKVWLRYEHAKEFAK